MKCTECPREVRAAKARRKQNERVRRTCGPRCSRARKSRLQRERRGAAEPPGPRYLRLCYELDYNYGLDEKNGRPYSWTNIVNAEEASKHRITMRRRYPGIMIWTAGSAASSEALKA